MSEVFLPFPALKLVAPAPGGSTTAEGLQQWAPGLEALSDMVAARTWLESGSQARLAVLVPHPETWLVRLMTAARTPENAIRAWRVQIEPLVDILRAYPQQIVIIPEDTLHLMDGIALLGAESGDMPPPNLSVLLPEPDPLLALIARETLRRDASALDLAGNLAAATPAAPERAAPAEPDLAKALYAYDNALGQTKGSNSALSKAEDQIAALCSRLAAADAGMSDLVLRVETRTRELAASRSEISLMRDQIRQEKSGLQQLVAQSAERGDQLAAARAAVQELTERAASTLGVEEDLRQELKRLGEREIQLARLSESQAQELEAQQDEIQLLQAHSEEQQADLAQRSQSREQELAAQRDEIRLLQAHSQEQQADLIQRTQSREQELAAQRDEIRLLQANSHEQQADLVRRSLSREQDLAAQRNEMQLLQTHSQKQQTDLVRQTQSREQELDAQRVEIRLLRALSQEQQADLVLQTRTREQELDAQHDEIRMLRAQVQEEQTARQNLRNWVHQRGEGLENTHAQLEALQFERDELHRQVQQLHQIREELEEYFDKAQHLSVEVGQLQTALEAGDIALDKSQQHSGWLENEIRQIHQSRSYRLMQPLRRIRLILRSTGSNEPPKNP